MWLTKGLCRRYHSLKFWMMIPAKSRKIPFRSYFASFLCTECKRVRQIEYPYCPICRAYIVKSHEHQITDEVVVEDHIFVATEITEDPKTLNCQKCGRPFSDHIEPPPHIPVSWCSSCQKDVPVGHDCPNGGYN